jgi:Holliday junction resolvase
MPNKNRRKGDYFERRTRDALEADGWVVIRSAGSFGPADLWAMREGRTAWLVSCKTNGYLSRVETIALNDVAEKAGAHAILAWQKRPGVVSLAQITRHGKLGLPPLRMPPVQRKRKPKTAPVDPDQMSIYDVLGND